MTWHSSSASVKARSTAGAGEKATDGVNSSWHGDADHLFLIDTATLLSKLG